jgi:glycine/D-amino acid oxidase-like deaminating enzyme
MMSELAEVEKSYWRTAYTGTLYPALEGDLEVDTVIVGAGITGLTAAYLLKKSGQKVAVVEKDTVGGGTTGRTTGKVSSQHELIYADLYSRLSPEVARIYGQANQSAVEKVAEIIKTERIDCDWKREDNYVFTTDKGSVEKIKSEAKIAAKLGLPASFTKDTPLPFEVLGAMKFAGQGKLHSQKYVLALAKAVNGQGSKVFEKSNVIGIRDGQPGRIKTKKGSIRAKHIIVATNVPTLPLMARGAYCILEYPTESYIIVGTPTKNIKSMYISPDSDNYSILPFESDKQKMLLIGGEGHISGLRGSRQARFEKLAAYGEKHFGIKSIQYKWSDRDYLAYDGIPLAGKAYPWSKNLYIASAFRKWGLSNGTASAMILHDLIMGVPNEWASVYNPMRTGPISSIPRVARQHIFGK